MNEISSTAEAPVVLSAPPPGPPRRRSRATVLVVALSLVTVVLLGLVVWLSLGRTTDTGAAPATTAGGSPAPASAPVTVVSVPPATSPPTVPSTTVPQVELATLTGEADVVGYIGPIDLPDGVQVAVLSRSGPGAYDDGRVELAVLRSGGWRVEQALPAGLVTAPIALGDATGDGRPEIVVGMSGMTGGKGWDVLYRIDADGPRLHEVPFDIAGLDAMLGSGTMSLSISSVDSDAVTTTVTTCTPSCIEDQGRFVEWQLDRSGVWTLRPMPQFKIPAPLDTSSSLVVGYEQGWENQRSYGDAGELADARDELSSLTGWQWSDDMVVALGASWCNNWEHEDSDDGLGPMTAVGQESWALSIAPVLGIDADAARIAIGATLDGSVTMHGVVCN